MLAYTTIGANNKDEALAFYDAIFGELGAQRVFNNDRLQFWSNGNGPMIGVGTPFEQEEAAAGGNGAMLALSAPDTDTVDRVYKKALELGATCEGEPGHRMPTFYGAYFRDKDGNKLCVCKIG